MTIFDTIRLAPWEVGAFKLSNLTEEDGSLIASGGKIRLCLPLEMKATLACRLGWRISILRTDSDYRIFLICT